LFFFGGRRFTAAFFVFFGFFGVRRFAAAFFVFRGC
jgi:hypothetical protein